MKKINLCCIIKKMCKKGEENMEKMLEYIGKLKEVDTDGIEPLTDIFSNGENVFREDIVVNGDVKEDILRNAPEKENDMFVVPKTV